MTPLYVAAGIALAVLLAFLYERRRFFSKWTIPPYTEEKGPTGPEGCQGQKGDQGPEGVQDWWPPVPPIHVPYKPLTSPYKPRKKRRSDDLTAPLVTVGAAYVAAGLIDQSLDSGSSSSSYDSGTSSCSSYCD